VGDLLIHIFTFLEFEMLLFQLEKYKWDFQIFITTMIKPIMEFFHVLFEILLFLDEKYKRYLQIFTIIVIKPIMDLL
jgi:hypothetical protein